MALAGGNHNHANFQRRIDFIRFQLPFPACFNLEKAYITPIEYDPECPFRYNNFVYRLTLSVPTISEYNAAAILSAQPGCTPVPAGVTEFIVRLTNSDALGMNTQNRVEDEVAIISVVGAALSQHNRKLVPHVYSWGSAAAESSQGWILQELMSGTPLDAALDRMNFQGKRKIFAQVSKILSEMQNYSLPPGIKGFGGVTFDAVGRIVSGPMTSFNAGPWSSYEHSYREWFDIALVKADSDHYIRGWHANGVRERVNTILDHYIPAQFRYLGSKERKVITHADLTPKNLLYDVASNRITALLDYDFACISHPSYEFFRSFGAGGPCRAWFGDGDTEQFPLHEARLHGSPSTLPPSWDEGVNWGLVQAWEDELEKRQVMSPRTIEGIEHVYEVDVLLRAIMPRSFTNPDILRMQSEEVKVKCRDDGEKQLIKILDRLGF